MIKRAERFLPWNEKLSLWRRDFRSIIYRAERFLPRNKHILLFNSREGEISPLRAPRFPPPLRASPMLGFYGGTGGGKGGRGKGGVEGTGGNCGRGGEGARGQRPANQDAGGRPKSLPKPSVSLRVVAFSCLLPPGAWACKQPAPRKPRSRRPLKLITKTSRFATSGGFSCLGRVGGSSGTPRVAAVI